MERISLQNEYVSVIREGQQTDSCGGNQNWFRGTPLEYAANQGCGMIAAVDVANFIQNRNRMSYDEYEKCIRRFLKQHPFTKLFLHEFRKNSKSVFAIGILPNQISRFLNRGGRQAGQHARFKWNGIHGHKNMYEKIKAMIKENLPVVWAIYSRKGRLNLYRFNSATGKYEVVASTNNHFVTAIAVEESLENQKLRRMIEVSSWGKRFYIDYDEYLEFVGNSLISKYCSNIMVKR
ncbi:MAG: hypothetical protein J6Y86_05540 [Pseudobutyrivibrio sp.]|nr:hypothetical protein [Pseudobutyrivibrio sp.]